jgi:hypothetical protein
MSCHRSGGCVVSAGDDTERPDRKGTTMTQPTPTVVLVPLSAELPAVAA